MRALLSSLVILSLWGCNQSTQTPTQQSAKLPVDLQPLNEAGNTSITCWGIGDIEFGDDLEHLEEKLGKEQISLDSLFLEGEFQQLISTVWKGSPKEVSILWKEEKPPFKTIKNLRITQSKSPYQFANGIKIGSTLNHIVKLNGGKDITLFGFGWDYGGSFVSFGKGKLAEEIPCFGGVFSEPATGLNEDASGIQGDHEITTAHPAFRKYEFTLSEIIVSNKD